MNRDLVRFIGVGLFWGGLLTIGCGIYVGNPFWIISGVLGVLASCFANHL